jgi:hypothetical protein
MGVQTQSAAAPIDNGELLHPVEERDMIDLNAVFLFCPVHRI